MLAKKTSLQLEKMKVPCLKYPTLSDVHSVELIPEKFQLQKVID